MIGVRVPGSAANVDLDALTFSAESFDLDDPSTYATKPARPARLRSSPSMSPPARGGELAILDTSDYQKVGISDSRTHTVW